MGKKKKTFEIGFFFRHEFKEQLRRMQTVSQVMEVLDAATDYVMTDNYSIQDPFSDLAFSAWKPCLKYEKETYLQVCEQNKINRQKREEKKIKKQQQPELFKEEASEEDDVTLVEAEEVEPYPFVEFWNTFNFKRNKQAAEKVWKKLNNKDRAAAMAAIPNYHAYLEHKRSTGFDQNNLYPATYLNGRRWEDDYSITDTTPQNYGNNRSYQSDYERRKQQQNAVLTDFMAEAAARVQAVEDAKSRGENI